MILGRPVNSTALLDEYVGHDGGGALGVAHKSFMWHCKPDVTQPRFCGHNGQTVICDIPSGTLVVHTAVSEEGHWQPELLAILQAAINRRGP